MLEETRNSMPAIASRAIPVISYLTLLIINRLVSLMIPIRHSSTPILPTRMLSIVRVCTVQINAQKTMPQASVAGLGQFFSCPVSSDKITSVFTNINQPFQHALIGFIMCQRFFTELARPG